MRNYTFFLIFLSIFSFGTLFASSAKNKKKAKSHTANSDAALHSQIQALLEENSKLKEKIVHIADPNVQTAAQNLDNQINKVADIASQSTAANSKTQTKIVIVDSKTSKLMEDLKKKIDEYADYRVSDNPQKSELARLQNAIIKFIDENQIHESRDEGLHTPLILAAKFDCLAVVKHLHQKKKVDLEAESLDGKNSLIAATERNNVEIVEYLAVAMKGFQEALLNALLVTKHTQIADHLWELLDLDSKSIYAFNASPESVIYIYLSSKFQNQFKSLKKFAQKMNKGVVEVQKILAKQNQQLAFLFGLKDLQSNSVDENQSTKNEKDNKEKSKITPQSIASTAAALSLKPKYIIEIDLHKESISAACAAQQTAASIPTAQLTPEELEKNQRQKEKQKRRKDAQKLKAQALKEKEIAQKKERDEKKAKEELEMQEKEEKRRKKAEQVEAIKIFSTKWQPNRDARKKQKIFTAWRQYITSTKEDQKKAAQFHLSHLPKIALSLWKKALNIKQNEENSMEADAINFYTKKWWKKWREKVHQYKEKRTFLLAQLEKIKQIKQQILVKRLFLHWRQQYQNSQEELSLRLQAVTKTIENTRKFNLQIKIQQKHIDHERSKKLKLLFHKTKGNILHDLQNEDEFKWHGLWRQFLILQLNLQDATFGLIATQKNIQKLQKNKEIIGRLALAAKLLKKSPQYHSTGKRYDSLTQDYLHKNLKHQKEEFRGADLLINAIRAQDFQYSERLLNSGVKIDDKNDHGITPLWAATVSNCVDSVAYLLAKKATITQAPNISAAIQSDAIGKLLSENQ